MRDDFALPVKEVLAKRVAYRCSNQSCRQVTSGPQKDPTKTINIGVAAHITAASPGGARFDPSMTSDQRQAAENGIWLCQSCAKLVDNDPMRYGVTTLRQWKTDAETTAAHELESRSNSVEKRLRVLSIITVLAEMYNRLETLANSEKAEHRDWREAREAADKITGFVQIPIPQVSSVDEAREAVEKAERQTADVFSGDAELHEKIRRIQQISRLLDRSGLGLKRTREADEEYSQLQRSVDEYYDQNKEIIDGELSRLIRSCIAFNESAANALLYIQLADAQLNLAMSAGLPNILTPSLESDIEGFGEDVRETARDIRIKVGEKIKTLVAEDAN